MTTKQCLQASAPPTIQDAQAALVRLWEEVPR